MIEFYVSTLSGHGIWTFSPIESWMVLKDGFWMRLTMKSEFQVKQIALHSVGGLHLINRRAY